MSDKDDNASTEWESLAEVGRYPDLEKAQEHGLVILAMREPCWVAPAQASGGFTLHAEPDALPSISRELHAYDIEQEKPAAETTPESEIFRFTAGWNVYALWMISLIAVFIWQHTNPSREVLLASSSTGLIGHGEWWRPFTGLFLHADLPHLVGNLLSGLLFGTLVARSIGPWRGWALILACGTLGNTLTSALTWPESFVSIGASTAVFGALGILSGLGFAAMSRTRLRLPWARTAAPVLAGVILLGWLGGGAETGGTDVLGHVFGFSSGLTAGILIGAITPETKRDGKNSRTSAGAS